MRARKDGSLWTGRDIGDLKAASPPAVYDERATLFKGLFQDTLPEALGRAFPQGRRADRLMVLNIDSDLYSSALYVLTSMHTLLRSGDYIYFDEFFDALNEFSAFNDYIRSYNTKSWFMPVARAYDGILFRIEVPEAETPAELIDRRSTKFLDRLKAYVRAACLASEAERPRARLATPPLVGLSFISEDGVQIPPLMQNADHLYLAFGDAIENRIRMHEHRA